MIPRGTTLVTTIAAVLWLAFGVPTTASDELTRARELYGAAEYDEALAVLDAVTADPDSADAIDVLRYRALCLVALDRTEDARNAIGALVNASPQFQLSENDASPRVRAMFAEVRKSLMPDIVQRAYADAKAAFDRKDPKAAAGFDRVLALLADPDAAGHPALADLATVAAGFRDLSKMLAAAPPAASTPPPTAATRTAVPPAAVANRTPPAATGTTSTPPAGGEPASAAIVPPVAISQTIPPLLVREQREWNGEVEVVINEQGKVTSARMAKPIHPLYDVQLLQAARQWTYRPALRDGVPAQVVKVVAVHVDSRPPCTGRVTASCRPVDGD